MCVLECCGRCGAEGEGLVRCVSVFAHVIKFETFASSINRQVCLLLSIFSLLSTNPIKRTTQLLKTHQQAWLLHWVTHSYMFWLNPWWKYSLEHLMLINPLLNIVQQMHCLLLFDWRLLEAAATTCSGNYWVFENVSKNITFEFFLSRNQCAWCWKPQNRGDRN